MSYKFIIGSAVSKKTETAFEECIRGDRGNRYIIIVPEQSTMTAQKKIVDMHPNHATMNIDVLSFNRLAYRVFQELGMEHPEMIDDIAKSLIVKRVALSKKEELTNYKKLLDKPGFISNMNSVISEFYQYGITPGVLCDALTQIKRAHLKTKLSETAAIYEGFQKFIEDRFITTEEVLDLLCKVLPHSKMLFESHIVLDGFTGFTPIQLRIIEIFLKQAKEVTITMHCDSLEEAYAKADDSDLFLLSKTAIQKITDMAKRGGVKHSGDIFVENNLQNSALNHLEKHFLRFDRFVPCSCEEAISITRLADIDAEIRFVTSNILKLIQDGMRYRDIAIVGRDLSNYRDGLEKRLGNLGIPLFVDENIAIVNNPLVEFVRSVLLLMSNAMNDENFLMYLKCRPDTDEEMVWELELYMKACGIRSQKKILSKWEYIPNELSGTDLAKLMAFRDEIVNELEPLRKLYAGATIHANTVISEVIRLLDFFSMEEKMAKMAKGFAAKEGENGKKSREYADIYEQVISLLQKISEILREEELEKSDLLGIFDAGIAEIRVGMIPASIDKVVLGDLIRTRLDDIKVLFIVGANEGVLISAKSQNAILSDRDKEALSKLGISLSPTMKEDIFIQRYYLYLMFTMAREKLFITFAGKDRAHNALKEASVLSQVQKLYTDLEISYVDSVHEVYSRLEAKERLIVALREYHEEEGEVAKWLPFVNMAKDLITAATFRYSDTGLSKEAADRIYGSEIIASATRLDHFVDCPYKHFLRYGLGLKEDPEYRFESADIGTLAHGIIERCFVLAKKENLDITKLSETERFDLIEKSLQGILSEDEKGIFEESSKNRHMVDRIAGMAKRILYILGRQLEKGDFKPEYFEKTFRVSDGLNALQFDLDNEHKLLLTGAIDRVDILEMEESILLKIIDYKTGSTKWETDLIYYGKQLQLILYLSAMKEVLKVTNKKEIIPAAFFYMHLDDPIIEAGDVLGMLSSEEMREYVQNETLSALRPSGVVNSEPNIIRYLDREIESKSNVIPVTLKDGNVVESSSVVASREMIGKMESFVKKKILQIGRRMIDGDVSVYPGSRKGRTACDFCPYFSVCGFDKKTKGYRYHNMPSLKNAKAWELIIGEEEDAVE